MLVNFIEDQDVMSSKLSRICLDLGWRCTELKIEVVDQTELARILDKIKAPLRNHAVPKIVLCGRYLEEQISALALFLLVQGFDTFLLRDLVEARQQKFSRIADHRLMQAGVVYTTVRQLFAEQLATIVEDQHRTQIMNFLKEV